MGNTTLIFLGAGIGGVLRYWMSNGVYFLVGKQFPYGTLVVNVTGCFLMGLLFVLSLERFDLYSSQYRAFLLVGLLGGYTTYSSFAIETVNLVENGDWVAALINILLTTVVCVAASWFGIILGRNI